MPRPVLHGYEPWWTLWLLAAAAVWLSLAIFVFNRGLRVYSSASS